MDELGLTMGGAGEGLGFELLAVSLRADERDARAFLGALAAKLEGALPAQTVVERARDGLFKSTTHVERVVVDLSSHRYTLGAGKRGGLEAARAKIVGGVSIKNDALPVDAWIDELARDLSRYAEGNAAARAALERLLT